MGDLTEYDFEADLLANLRRAKDLLARASDHMAYAVDEGWILDSLVREGMSKVQTEIEDFLEEIGDSKGDGSTVKIAGDA